MDNRIVDLLNEMAADQAEINLMNVYKGVPLSFPAKIVAGSGQWLRVLTDQYQVVCMYIDKETFIQSKRLPEILQAKVIELDPHQRVATLASFSRVESGIGERMNVRVQPEDPLEGNIQNQPGGRTLRGELADISQDGLAVYLIKEVFSSRQFYKGAQIAIQVRLPVTYETGLPRTGPLVHESPMDRFDRENLRFTPHGSMLRGSGGPAGSASPGSASRSQILRSPDVLIKGVIANTRLEESRNHYRVGVRILPNDPSRPLIGRFIVQRQSEIIREIKTLYDLLAQDTGK